jgi:hypothetical protein
MVDIGREPGKNRRLQKTITRDRRKDADADAEIKRIGHQRRTGEYVIPTKLTVNTALERGWLHVHLSAGAAAGGSHVQHQGHRPSMCWKSSYNSRNDTRRSWDRNAEQLAQPRGP